MRQQRRRGRLSPLGRCRSLTGGSGLGLSIVRTLVEAHGGAVTVRRTVGEGSEFMIHLPRTVR
ncbi:ATP-binding protein [Streptomyces sp. GMR22]|uniref:ATP-binding protein n=1 Tax=Streptomyces sp. GMR22 TaxID=2759524 RepID=UPI0015FD7413|nr:ATP-binding protein [Streptomyces sp. GMR22]MBA6441512.1 hypothetical protein [Streptomyces sp. GMR22]